eukprot:3915085-Rhodomonas_salina.1
MGATREGEPEAAREGAPWVGWVAPDVDAAPCLPRNACTAHTQAPSPSILRPHALAHADARQHVRSGPERVAACDRDALRRQQVQLRLKTLGSVSVVCRGGCGAGRGLRADALATRHPSLGCQFERINNDDDALAAQHTPRTHTRPSSQPGPACAQASQHNRKSKFCPQKKKKKPKKTETHIEKRRSGVATLDGCALGADEES